MWWGGQGTHSILFCPYTPEQQDTQGSGQCAKMVPGPNAQLGSTTGQSAPTCPSTEGGGCHEAAAAAGSLWGSGSPHAKLKVPTGSSEAFTLWTSGSLTHWNPQAKNPPKLEAKGAVWFPAAYSKDGRKKPREEWLNKKDPHPS